VGGGGWGERSKEKRQLGRPRRKWKDNMKMALQDVGWGKMDWIALAQDKHMRRALVNAVMNIHVLKNSGNFMTS